MIFTEISGKWKVWNQPVQGYQVTNAAPDGKLKEVSKADAVAALGADVAFTELMGQTTVKAGERKTGVFKATTAGELTFRLSGTHDADLDLKKGAEVTEAAYDQKSAGDSAAEKCKITVAVGDEVHYLVLGYAEESEVTLAIGTQTPNNEYTFNTNAMRFFYVEMNLNYITEASPAHESHATASGIAEHTNTDVLKFILEIDGQDRIMGGEWVDESRTHHPDFMWWPTGEPTGSRAGVLTYDDVKMLNDEASADL